MPFSESTESSALLSLKCPTCGLRFHGQNQCRRCGTDLTLLMRTAFFALVLRNRARDCLRQGRIESAWRTLQKAQSLQDTPAGRSLLEWTAMALHDLASYPPEI